MRFFVFLAELVGIYILCKINIGEILPVLLFDCFTYFSRVLLCAYLFAWIPELFQFFCKSTVLTDNRAVLITGCDSGFGHALAKRLHKKGFKVYAGCLDPASYGAQQLEKDCGDSLEVVYLDVTDNSSIQAAKDFIRKNLQDSELWAVVNNAGVLKGFHIELSSMEDFEVCMQVNALGPVRVTRAFIPLLKKSKGRVVNVCSLAGRIPAPYLCAYNMSKYAAVAFTEVLKFELKEFGIRAISIEPEFFRTPMSSKENVTRCLQHCLASVDEKIKAEYGERYIEKAKKSVFTTFTSSSPNINLVLEAMEASVCLKYPDYIYKPCRNVIFHIIAFIAERAPKIYVEIFFEVFFKLFGVPMPCSGVSFCENLMTI